MNRLFLLLPLLLSLPLSAQIQPQTQGFFANFALTSVSVSYDDEGVDGEAYRGGGLDLRLGYGFTPTFTLYAGLGGYNLNGESATAFQEDFGLGIFEIGGRFHFGKKQKRTIFHLDVALQSAVATPEINFAGTAREIEIQGGGLSLAPGVLFYLSDHFALDLTLVGSGGTAEIEAGDLSNFFTDDFSYGIGRLNLGVVWYPGNKR